MELLLYHEKQEESLCAKHTVNNICGSECTTKDDAASAQAQFLGEAAELLADGAAVHEWHRLDEDGQNLYLHSLQVLFIRVGLVMENAKPLSHMMDRIWVSPHRRLCAVCACECRCCVTEGLRSHRLRCQRRSALLVCSALPLGVVASWTVGEGKARNQC